MQTHEEDTVYVGELDVFLTMKVLENTPAVLSLGKLCDEHGCLYEWINGQKPHLIKNGFRIQCNTEKLRSDSCSRLVSKFFLVFREKFFASPTASSSAPYPQESNPWISDVSEHTSPHVKAKHQLWDQRCQSRQAARNSFIPSEGKSSKNYWVDEQRLQISDFHFDKFPNPATFACWKIKLKSEVCICSQLPTEAVLRIKQVEMVNRWMI